jgi:uncharacterized protein (TIGR03066 family)
MNTLKLLAVGAVVCLISAGTRAEDKIDYAKLIVGKWEVTKAEEGTLPVGTMIEFTKDGKLKINGKKDATELVFEGTYKVEGSKFNYVMKVGDDEHKDTIDIVKLTETEMSTKNKDGKTLEVKKAK